MRNCRQDWAYPLRIAKHSLTLRGLKVGECFAKVDGRGAELTNVSQNFSFKRNFVENWSDVSHGIQISNSLFYSPSFCVLCLCGAFEGRNMHSFRKEARLCEGEASGRSVCIDVPSMGQEIDEENPPG